MNNICVGLIDMNRMNLGTTSSFILYSIHDGQDLPLWIF